MTMHPNPILRQRSILPLALALGFASMIAGAAPISTKSLIPEMLDLKGMVEFPDPAYTCKQSSSYDRASKSPDKDWFANGDAGQYLRVEDGPNGKEHVMLDAEGPGAVVRIWSANPAGTIRIYIDGAKEPEISAPMSDLLGGKYPGLPKPISGEYSKGWNLYLPITYAQHCKITSDKGGFYYHVNYRTYQKETKVESFKVEQIETLQGEIEKLTAGLAAPSKLPLFANATRSELDAEIPPGESVDQRLDGPAIILGGTCKVTAEDLEAALRGVILRAEFDGEQCVEVPLGDFFGSAPGINAFETLPLAMSKDGTMSSRWAMPFKRGALLQFVNMTGKPVRLSGDLQVAPYQWTERSMHFHAGWRAQFDVPTRPMQDWNYITTKGQGVFAGVSFAIDNPVKQWWGEGDEKIYVDGESFPSHFGTGTEDYYGYAWCWPGLFTHAYHSQSRCDGPGNYGRTSVNRFHIIDRIPFTRSFKFDMELWHWHENAKVNMAVTAYWYALAGAQSEFRPVTREMAVVRPMPAYIPPKVAGAIEGETIKVIHVDGKAQPQDWGELSGEQHLWWNEGVRPGGRLSVSFDAPQTGKYQVFARFLSAKDYGIHQLSINGRKAGEPIDFYEPNVKPTKERELGVFDLKKSGNMLDVEAIGANPKAVKSYMFGLDYLRLKPVP